MELEFLTITCSVKGSVIQDKLTQRQTEMENNNHLYYSLSQSLNGTLVFPPHPPETL